MLNTSPRWTMVVLKTMVDLQPMCEALAAKAAATSMLLLNFWF